MGSENKICFLFQSTHPRRVWQCELFTLFRFWYVSIHTPTKGVTSESYLKTLGPWSFNPHTHEGCDTAIANSDVAKRSFNPHTHEGCDLATTTGWLQSSCFNPHTHEGCDLIDVLLLLLLLSFQSTHPRRVWQINNRLLTKLRSFNPHTHEGCDIMIALLMSHPLVFQSTHPRRVWLVISIHLYNINMFQSTHPRRVWLSEINRSHVHLCFNPHTHEGCDLLECSTNGNVKKFQSTHPRRVWLHVFVFLSRFVLFQSTHPRRVWHFLALRGGFGVGVSIHTPTKGVTLKQKQGDISEYVSIHTPTKGVTAEDWYHRPYIHCFNPHTHEGCDCSHHFRPRSATLFQSTHPRRVWPWNQKKSLLAKGVSIHTPTKGVTYVARRFFATKGVSIHTPTKGVTDVAKGGFDEIKSFNPHTHEGCDSLIE